MARRKKSLQSIPGVESLSGSGKAQTVEIHLPSVTPRNYGNRVSVFGSPCKFCGDRFGRYSLQLHMKKCQNRGHELSTHTYTGKRKCEQQKYYQSCEGVDVVSEEEAPLARQLAETASAQTTTSPPRTRTRSLERSVLVGRGFTLPIIECSSNSAHVSFPCKICGEMIGREDTFLHQKTCRPQSRTVAKGNITFPTLRPNYSPSNPPHLKKVASRRPPTVVCYICGREYGSMSISIHEPQCLKKFELENRKLPIKERKPLPKKPINHAALVVPFTSQEHRIPPPNMATGGVYNEEVLQETTDQYFQYCYSEWKKDLITCKTCCRSFAPERHAKHVHRCKAKPLPGGVEH